MSRCSLYVPGNRPDRFPKALASGPSAIILDLEDAVPEAEKATARDEVAIWLAANPSAPAWVRVNNRPDLLVDDVAMARERAPLGIVVPKAEPEVCAIAGVDVVALIESATGVARIDELAGVPAVRRLAIGEADLAADLGMDPSPDGRELAAIRSQVVVASAANGLEPPTGPVFTDLDDLEGLRRSSETLRRLGFGGRSAIHPSQVPVIDEVFRPSAAEIARAEAVLQAYGDAGATTGGVVVVDGEFVDAAVARRARLLLAQSVDP